MDAHRSGPNAVALPDGWRAVGEGGGWRGVHPDGRTTHLVLNINVIQRHISEGWFSGEPSVVAPADVPAKYGRGRHAPLLTKG